MATAWPEYFKIQYLKSADIAWLLLEILMLKLKIMFRRFHKREESDSFYSIRVHLDVWDYNFFTGKWERLL